MCLLVGRFVLGLVGVDHQRRAQTSLCLLESAFAKSGQHQEIENAPVLVVFQMQHRLAELFLAVDTFDQVDLVDHVDQVLGFDHAPEHRVDTDAPLVIAVDVKPQRLAHIGVLAALVFAVGANEQLEAPQVVAIVPLAVPLGLERRGQVLVELLIELRRLREQLRLERDVAGKLGRGMARHQQQAETA